MVPEVSIVIPSYNHAHFLPRTLLSIISQTFGNWEAIIVDNHSTDHTDQVVASFNDKRIRVLKIHNDGVIAASRNMGIKSAQGNWVALLDSDDWWTPDKLEVCLTKSTDTTDVIFHDLSIVGVPRSWFTTQTITGRELRHPVLVDLLVNGNAIANSSVMIRRWVLTSISGISETREMIAGEDYNTWLKASLVTENFLYIPAKLGFYLVHGGGMSQKDMSVPWRHATEAFIDRLTDEQKSKAEALFRYERGRFAYINGQFQKARPDLLYVLNYGPLRLAAKSTFMLFMCLIKKQ